MQTDNARHPPVDSLCDSLTGDSSTPVGSPAQLTQKSEDTPGEIWWTKIRHRLVQLAHRFLWNHADAEEVAQEALALAWERLKDLKDEGRRNAWAYRTTINLCLNRRRLKRPQPGACLESLATDGQIGDGDASELASRVRAVMQDLPENQYAALVLRELEGLSYEQVAAIVEVRESTARVLVHRARETVRTRLIERWPDTFGPMM